MVTRIFLFNIIVIFSLSSTSIAFKFRPLQQNFNLGQQKRSCGMVNPYMPSMPIIPMYHSAPPAYQHMPSPIYPPMKHQYPIICSAPQWPYQPVYNGELHNPNFNPLNKPKFIPEYNPIFPDNVPCGKQQPQPKPVPQPKPKPQPIYEKDEYIEEPESESLYEKPEPAYEVPPKPIVYKAPKAEPIYHEPMKHESEPDYHEPEPELLFEKGEPEYKQPQPKYEKPQPVYEKPEKIQYDSEPVYEEHEDYSEPAAPAYPSKESNEAPSSDIPCTKNVLVDCGPFIQFVDCDSKYDHPKRYAPRIRSILSDDNSNV